MANPYGQLQRRDSSRSKDEADLEQAMNLPEKTPRQPQRPSLQETHGEIYATPWTLLSILFMPTRYRKRPRLHSILEGKNRWMGIGGRMNVACKTIRLYDSNEGQMNV